MRTCCRAMPSARCIVRSILPVDVTIALTITLVFSLACTRVRGIAPHAVSDATPTNAGANAGVPTASSIGEVGSDADADFESIVADVGPRDAGPYEIPYVDGRTVYVIAPVS